MIYKRWDVVVVPFPFVDHPVKKSRPVLILSSKKFAKENGQFIGAMITTTQHQKWYGDYEITNLKAAGLPIASKIRFKVFTLDFQAVAKPIGRLSKNDRTIVEKIFSSVFGD